MKAFLDYAIASEGYMDNARPEFLTNPATGERLEYDRYYFDGVAFEFNGTQHNEQTDRFQSARQLRDTQMRDLIKIGRSVDARITLVTVHPHQLHPEVIVSLLPDCLPRRTLDFNGPYLRAMARFALGYAAKAQSQTM
jgi:hypothetical protein